MPKTRISCPQCRQPIVADINQLFDVGLDPRSKQLLLSGQFNMVMCPNCGYQGNLASPIVYHDPSKELLLTYFPPELGPVNEQERLIGPLLKQVMDNLPQEKRKAYLFRPQNMFTIQTLIERILEGDGITKEMIQAQQKKLNLLQRMLSATDDAFAQIVQTEDELIDAEFFALLGRLGESAIMAGEQDTAARLADIQQKLMLTSTVGKQAKQQSDEVEAAIQTLQSLGDDLTQEKLLELFLEAPNDTRLSVMASLTRQGIDYGFFQLLSSQIDAAQGEQREKLLALREKLIEITRAVDQQMENRLNQARNNLNELLKAPDVALATQQNLAAIDEFFVRVLGEEMEAARKTADLGRIGQLQKIANVIEQASQPPAEVELIEKLLSSEDDATLWSLLENNRATVVSPTFVDTMANLVAQFSNSEDQPQEVKDQLQWVFETVLRFSMESKID
jgi:hypothetical protein